MTMGILDHGDYKGIWLLLPKMLNVQHMGPLNNALNKAGIC